MSQRYLREQALLLHLNRKDLYDLRGYKSLIQAENQLKIDLNNACYRSEKIDHLLPK